MPTNLTNGVTNVPESSTLGAFIMPDPSSCHVFHDDFDRFTASDWVNTKTGTGTAVATSTDGGNLVLTNTAGGTDAQFLQWAGGSGGVLETFKFETRRPLWFKARFKVNDATNSALVFGLQVTDTTPLAVSDGVYFLKAAASTAVSFNVAKSSTSSTSSSIATLADNTFVVLGFYFDGYSTITAFLNDNRVAALPVTNMPDVAGATISFGIQNGAAAAKSMTIDYIMAAKQRERSIP